MQDLGSGVKVVSTKYYRVNPWSVINVAAKNMHKPGYLRKMFTGKPEDRFLSRYYRSQNNGFTPETKGGKTEVTILDTDTGKEYTGVAYCSMDDGFCYKTGRDIALLNALLDMLSDYVG